MAGFFGKLPTTGDFVSRGLPDAFRKNWDAWLTRHVAPLLRQGLAVAAGGLRFRLASGGRIAAGVILPSQDSAGRHFPLSLLLIADGGLTRPQIDGWCDAALTLRPDRLAPEDLWHALEALPIADPSGPATGSLQLWLTGGPVLDADATQPADALRHLITA